MVVVGAGHNGLVAAAYLARAGPAHGGGRAPRDRRRRLHDRGVRARVPRLAGRLRAQPPAAGDLARFLAARSGARGPRGGADAERVPRRRAADAPRRRPRDRARARPLRPSRRGRLPGLSSRAGRDRRPARPVVRSPGARGARVARPRFACGRSAAASAPARRHGLAAAKLFATSARDHLEQRFASEYTGAALGWDAISNTLAGPSTPGTAYSLLHEHAAASLGGAAWGFVRGGMGTVTALLADAATEAGAEIVTGAPVERILVDDGRVERGPARRGRASSRRRTVVSNADPKRTLLGLVGRDRLDPRIGRRDRGLSLRGREPEDQPRARRAAADRGHPGRPAEPPPRADPVHPAARRHGRRPGGRPARDPGPGSARGALRPERPRPVARAAGAPRRDPRLSLPALPAGGVGLGQRARPDRGSPAGRAGDDDPEPRRGDHRPPGADAARPRAHPRAHRRPPPARRHVARPARAAAARRSASAATGRRSPGSTCAAPGPTPGAASRAPTGATARGASSPTGAAGVSRGGRNPRTGRSP